MRDYDLRPEPSRRPAVAIVESRVGAAVVDDDHFELLGELARGGVPLRQPPAATFSASLKQGSTIERELSFSLRAGKSAVCCTRRSQPASADAEFESPSKLHGFHCPETLRRSGEFHLNGL